MKNIDIENIGNDGQVKAGVTHVTHADVRLPSLGSLFGDLARAKTSAVSDIIAPLMEPSSTTPLRSLEKSLASAFSVNISAIAVKLEDAFKEVSANKPSYRKNLPKKQQRF